MHHFKMIIENINVVSHDELRTRIGCLFNKTNPKMASAHACSTRGVTGVEISGSPSVFHWSLLWSCTWWWQTFWQPQPHRRKPIPKRDFLMPIYTEKFVWFCEKGARKKHADFCELTTNKCRLRNWIFNGNALRTIGTVVKRPTYDGLRVAGVYCMI